MKTDSHDALCGPETSRVVLLHPARRRRTNHQPAFTVWGEAQTAHAGVRDATFISLAYLSETRCAEIAALHLADIELDPPSLRVVDKGGKQRLVPISPTATPFLQGWIALRGTAPGPVFCPIDRGGNLRHGKAITGESHQALGRAANGFIDSLHRAGNRRH